MKMCEASNCSDKVEMGAPRYPTPREEVFNKTLALYCVLLDKGCAFDIGKYGTEFEALIEGEEPDSETEDSEDLTNYDSRHKHFPFRCQGRMVICSDWLGRPYIQYVCLSYH
jgi:hypothetical protein